MEIGNLKLENQAVANTHFLFLISNF